MEVPYKECKLSEIEFKDEPIAFDVETVKLYGRIRLAQFYQESWSEVILVNNPKGMIIDLRYNGGGYLDIAVDITSEFVPGNKPVVLLKTRNEDDNETFYVNDNARLPDIPLVVLVNKGSASASEILAGAIQDHKRGLIMGEQTYGKGSVQEIDILEDGSSLRLTIAKWLTPSGRDIEEVGILPDRIIEFSLEDFENDIDNNDVVALFRISVRSRFRVGGCRADFVG